MRLLAGFGRNCQACAFIAVPLVLTKDHLPHGIAIGKTTCHDRLRVRTRPASAVGAVGDSDMHSEMAIQALFNNRLGLVKGT